MIHIIITKSLFKISKTKAAYLLKHNHYQFLSEYFKLNIK